MPYELEDKEGYERTTTHMVARAVVAERERCAKIVETLFYARSSLGDDLILCGDMLDAAAAAIRKVE